MSDRANASITIQGDVRGLAAERLKKGGRETAKMRREANADRNERIWKLHEKGWSALRIRTALNRSISDRQIQRIVADRKKDPDMR